MGQRVLPAPLIEGNCNL